MEYTVLEKIKLIKNILLESKENKPILLLNKIMKEDFVNIHGPEHHFIDGACFMVCLHNNGLEFDLEKSLNILEERSIKMPGAMCGYWGVCGSVASFGAVFSIIDETGPLSCSIDYSFHMEYTSKVLSKMSEIGGPRCCKRNAYLSLIEAINYANIHYNLNIKMDKIVCEFSIFNKECLKTKCPFYKK